MFIELVEILRCPVSHEDTWLVASIDALDGRHIVAGSLGCPVCRATYRIVDGVLYMSLDGSRGAPRGAPVTSSRLPSDDDVIRAAALLGISEGGGRYALAGIAGALASGLEQATGVTLLLVSPPARVEGATGSSVVQAGGALPVGAGALRGILVDETFATPAFLERAVRALGAGGRLVAPASASVPGGVRVLARDDREWVAERETGSSAPVPLRRR